MKWTRLMAMAMILTLPLIGTAGDQAPSQVAEQVFDQGDCVEALVPQKDFKIHIPLDERGEPVPSRMYSTGGVQVVMKKGCQPRIDVRRLKPASYDPFDFMLPMLPKTPNCHGRVMDWDHPARCPWIA